jgi:uncharacterized protein YciI
MYGLVLIRYRLPLEEVVKATEEHRVYLRELKAKGILLAAGPFDPRTGGALLVRVPTENAQEALTAVRDGDPFFSKGVANYELIAWNVVIGNEELDKL